MFPLSVWSDINAISKILVHAIFLIFLQMKSMLSIPFLALALMQLVGVFGTRCLCKDGITHEQGDRATGCHKGYCWSLCQGAGCALTLFQNEWCYTSLDHSQSFHYMPCSNDDECTKHPKVHCAGSCTVSPFGIGSPDFSKYC